MVTEVVREVGEAGQEKTISDDEDEDFLDEYGNIRPAGVKASSKTPVRSFFPCYAGVWDRYCMRFEDDASQ
jgi:hypothetical protein